MIRRKLARAAVLTLLALMTLAALFPLVFTILNSFMSGEEIIRRYSDVRSAENAGGVFWNTIHFVEFALFPYAATVEQHVKMLTRSPLYLMMFWNSLAITAPVVLGQTVVSALAAFAFEHMRWRYKETLYFVYIVVMLMPLQVLLVPNFIVADAFGFTDSYLAIILPGIFSPFGVFLIRQHLKGFPKEYAEAAQVDGAGMWSYFVKIVLPCAKPTLTALMLLTFVEYWNVVDQAVVFINKTYREPLSVYLSRMTSLDMGMVFAASALYVIPTLLLFFAGTEQMTEGVRLSGLKA